MSDLSIQVSPKASASVEARPTGREHLVSELIRAILQGKYRAGARLVEQELATQLGVSRTPIREAIASLAAMGLVEMRVNRGAVVRGFGKEQLRQMYELRRILECAAIRLACGKIPLISLESLYARMTLLDQRTGPQWSDRAMAMDRRMHDLIARHCGNDRLADEIQRYRDMIQAARDLVGNQQQAQRLAVAAHKRIIEALLNQDADASVSAMDAHIIETHAIVSETLFPDESVNNVSTVDPSPSDRLPIVQSPASEGADYETMQLEAVQPLPRSVLTPSLATREGEML